MDRQEDFSATLIGWGCARADLPAIAVMRKTPPAWAPAGTPGHFLKYADEQTVVAVAAVDRAIGSLDRSSLRLSDWTIIGAPRYAGRIAGANTLARFARGGGPAISPHVIPQHSLHSMPGALSILLGSQRPNFGVGGGQDALAEGLLAALALPRSPDSAGTWLICTAWDCEPLVDEEANCTNAPVCHAVALALQAGTSAQIRGRLRLVFHGDLAANERECLSPSVPALATLLDAAGSSDYSGRIQWHVPWGAIIALDASPTEARRFAAA